MKFEQSIKRLEEIVAELDNNEISLEDSLKLYEEGTLLVKKCADELENAKLKIETLTGNGDNNE